ncbi:sugar phosphate isomerase/epimerase family protein [Enterococcus nangangensis]|uniref:sugar phosphate isomerase/epimerase family protein n=1 Tax=Enterococcus nangangensis TaxID=2559926 RepID=UPI0010F6D390|nr:sugar phosphate isomerase/epimerase family protein [Enterococcus nangangensis]
MIPINLGMRAHDLVAKDRIELASKLQQYGLTNIQLAVKKSFPELAPSLQQITHGTASYLGDYLKSQGIKISILGAYVNIASFNDQVRNEAIASFCHHLTLARDFGCTVVGTETGNVAGSGYSVENFTETAYLRVRDAVIQMVTAAEKLGALVGIEPCLNAPLYTWQQAKRLLSEVQSPNLKIILDAANLMRPDNYQDQVKVTYEALDALQDDIVAFHLKDFIVENGHIKIVPVGTGLMDYTDLLKFAKYQRPLLPTSLEAVKEEHLAQSIAFLQAEYARL